MMMMPFKACFAPLLAGLLLVLLLSPTCSAFQPVSLLPQRRYQLWSSRPSSSSSSRVMVSLWSRPEVDLEPPSHHTPKKMGDDSIIITPSSLLATAIRYHSTVLVACMALLFSTMIVEPASFVAWAGETTTTTSPTSSSQSQSTVVQASSPKQAELSVLDEVWTKINNYYIDRSFNGQVKKDIL
jgi:hypothetical protein